jgi:copper transport protein
VLALLSIHATALSPAAAWGHAAFLDSEPAAGTRIEAGPGRITLTFTEPLDRALSEATLLNAETGERIPAGLAEAGERELALQPEARLGRDPYRVEWHTVSTVDGHALEGAFGFGVRTNPTLDSEHAVEQSPLARDGWLRIAARAVFYGALFFFAGGLFAAALLGGREWLFRGSPAGEGGVSFPGREGLSERAWRRTIDVGWVAAGAAAAVALIEAWDASGSLAPSGLSDFLLSNDAGLARVGTAAAVSLAVLQAGRWPKAASAWLGISFFAIALGGHANSAEPRALAVATDWVHLLAGAIWIGGIAQLALFWLPLARTDRELSRAAMRSVLPRFGRLALPAFLIVASTGLANALIELGGPEALWESAYGRLLAVKFALVALIALASYGHALRLRPRLAGGNPHPSPRLERRHWRLLASEPFLAAGVIAAAAALVTFPLPPQQLGEADEAAAAVPCEGCPLPKANADELAVAEQAGPNIAAFWLSRSGDHLDGTLRLLDSNARPVEAELDFPAGEAEGCGPGCWRLTAPAGPPLRVSVESEGETDPVTVPSSWAASRAGAARGLLRTAQRRMRSLRSLRLEESVTSGLGVTVLTDYRFLAPDRMAYETNTGSRLVAIGGTRYVSTKGGPYERGAFGGGGFRMDELFRWSVYARTVRWLEADRDSVTLALFDPATPVWYRLRIERGSGRIVDERMVAEGHFMNRRYFAFDRPLSIEAPE